MTTQSREVHIEHLLGRTVFDIDGVRVGRIEELEATRENNECLITNYMVGDYALAERLAMGPVMRTVLRNLPRSYVSYRIPWDCMDLSDPVRPRTTCTKGDLPKAD